MILIIFSCRNLELCRKMPTLKQNTLKDLMKKLIFVKAQPEIQNWIILWEPIKCFVDIWLHFDFILTGAVARKCSVKKVFLNILRISQKNTCARDPFIIKLHAEAWKKRLWHKYFPVNFVKFLRKTFFIKHLWWLLLKQEIWAIRDRGYCSFFE